MRKYFICFLLALVIVTGCNKKPKVVTNPTTPPDPVVVITPTNSLRTAKTQVANVAASLRAAVKTVVAFKNDGSISKPLSDQVLKAIGKVVSANEIINKRLADYSTLDDTAKNDLATQLDQLIKTLQDANKEGLLGIKNEASIATVNGIFQTVESVIRLFRKSL